MNTHKQKLIVALNEAFVAGRVAGAIPWMRMLSNPFTTHEWKKAERERCEYVARLADVWDGELQDEEAL